MIKVDYCSKCDICIFNNHNPVWGYGNEHTDIMFIGEAPGATERTKNLPFVGKAGQALRVILQMYGFNSQNSYFTNIVKCRPPANREPYPTEIRNCMEYLITEIKEIKPKFIVLLGNTALRTFYGDTNLQISRHNAKVYILGNKVIFPMYHPSYLVRSPEFLPEFEKAMNLLLRVYLMKNPTHVTNL